MIELWVKGNITKHDTITNAYNYYLNNYATKKDYKYYKKVSNLSLNNITNERIMLAIFRNVFPTNMGIYIDIKEE